MTNKFVIFSLKLLTFRLVITYFGVRQIAPDHTFFVKNFPDPPSNSVCTQCYGAKNTPAILLSF